MAPLPWAVVRVVQGQGYCCPAGHVMEELVTHKAGYLRCDVCGAAQNVGRRMQGCWDCDYHVCCLCEKKFQDAEWYASWLQFWRGNKPKDVTDVEPAETVETVDDVAANEPAGQRQVPRCPGKHTLCQYFSAQEAPIQCDVCGKQLAPYVRIWGCSLCDYDIGPCCERKFEDPQFLESWQSFWCVSKEEPKQEEPPMPAPCDPPTVSSSSNVPEVAATVVTVAEGPKVTRPKPVQIIGLEEELVRTAAESSRAMVLGGQNEVVAPALMKAVLKKDDAKTPRATNPSNLDPAVLRFARKVKGTTKNVPSVSEETSGSKDVSIVPDTEEEEKKSKKKKEDKEKSEKSEKKEKKSKKEGKESRKDGDEAETPEASRSPSRRVKKSRHEADG
ncbi:unnamed protein product [Cladocopium goreaui]|uniref:Uncharacterized protein n=1 Tax=Cladocopium goreaui TaxID=2562237 RepID=A0A9P1BLZ9_9DINO|nr:unnamed protein product [Cladocopium goreaui]